MKLYQVDTFTTRLFTGNPAAVCPLSEWLPDEVMQKIAAENNLSETAFYIEGKEGKEWPLRWFTPVREVDLCGHATLASAHVLFTHRGYSHDSITFVTRSGKLIVNHSDDGYVMDFPADFVQPATVGQLETILGVPIPALYSGNHDLLAIVEDEESVRLLDPDIARITRLPYRGVIVSAPGRTSDFVSRCFYPAYGIPEDPVTGSAHTTLTPYWAGRLDKEVLSAQQLSSRGGTLICRMNDDRVIIEGKAVTYLEGEIQLY